MASSCKPFTEVFSFTIPSEVTGHKAETVIAKSLQTNFLYYIPIISTIFAAVMLSVVTKNNKGSAFSAEDKALVARCIIALTPLGILLLLVDIVGTIMKTISKNWNAPSLEGRATVQ